MDIFIDWGSTNFRAFLMNDGKVAGRKEASGGGTLKGFTGASPETRCNDYSAFFIGQTGAWLHDHPQAPIYICGAAGGREGWVETAYSEAPAGLDKIKKNLHKIPPQKLGHAGGREIYIASGCAVEHANGRYDVMRGEDVKSLGAAAHLGLSDILLCVPGTHCKWVHVKGGRIVDFSTAMTGEIYSILGEKGALAAIFQSYPSAAEPDFASFDRGVQLAAEGFDLLTDIWQVRAQKLRAKSPPPDLQAYFSGILIGHELRQMEKFYAGKPPTILLADNGPKELLYRHAFGCFNWRIETSVDNETAVCKGLSALKY